MPFEFRYRVSGAMPTVQPLTAKDSERLTKGDLGNLETGELDLAATADTNLVGVIQETKDGVDSTTKHEIITDPDAVYGVKDNNARVIGATLDLAGTTGAQTVAASSNKEFVVVADSRANEETLVRINVGKHYQSKAQ